jgi:ribokinase
MKVGVIESVRDNRAMSETAAAVIVVGSVNMDLVFTGLSALPTPGQTVSSENFVVMPGGKGANQASAAARLGATVEFIAAIGTDDLGDQAFADLERSGVRLTNVARVNTSTGVAAVLIEDSGENVVIVTPGANATLVPEDAATIAATLTHEHAVVLACLEVPVEVVTAWSRVAAVRGWSFILNPAPAPAQPLPAELLANTTIITPNETELVALAAGAEPAEAVARLHEAGVPTVVVTRGGDGADLYREGESLHHQPAFPATPVDTTGAGDAFNGALAASIAAGSGILEALSIAAAAGALSTRRVGARDALATREEVAELRAN